MKNNQQNYYQQKYNLQKLIGRIINYKILTRDITTEVQLAK